MAMPVGMHFTMAVRMMTIIVMRIVVIMAVMVISSTMTTMLMPMPMLILPT